MPTNFADKARLEGTPANLLGEYAHDDNYLGVARGGMKLADVVTKGFPQVSSTLEDCIRRSNVDAQCHGAEADEDQIVDYYDNLYRSIVCGA